MTTKTIPHNSSVGVYYGASAANYTIVNNFTILNPTSNAGSRYGDNAVDLYESNNLTLLNSGTIDSRYSAAGGLPGAGVLFLGTPSQHVSITNTSVGVIEDTGGFGYGIHIQGGTVVNFGLISGGVGPTNYGNTYYGIGINIGSNGGFISNASTGIITNGGIVGHGLTTIVNAGKIQGFTASNIYGAVSLSAGGIITNLSTGTITPENGAYGIKIAGAAGTVINAGYIDGGSKGGDAVILTGGFANLVVVDPGARFHGTVNGGSAAQSTLELGSGAAKGTLTGFNSQYINFGTLAFAPSAQWLFETNSANTPGVIDGFVQGDTIDITGFTATSISTLTGNKGVVLTNSGGIHETLSFGGSISNFEYQTGTFGTDLTTICFCTGTQIATPNGEVPVQTLKAGDTVLTAHNGPRAVSWVGTGKVLATSGKRGAATPVIVRKGALADNLPHRDLHVTKAHSLYIDDVLIPVEFLVNHKTILWDDRAQEVEIYHIELESHDLLIANGVPAESYRDDGNRWLFQNANEGWHLPPQEPYAPVLTGGPIVDAAWQRFLDRAGPRDTAPLTDDPDLHLIVDGARVEPWDRQAGLYVFLLPACPSSVVLASRAGVPSELGTARDPRSLGVALRQVTIKQGAKFMLFDADDERLTAGFHDYEPSDRLRWTDGYAELPAEAFARFDQGAVVTLYLGGATQYPDYRDHAEQVAA
jgi:hypothetical protein